MSQRIVVCHMKDDSPFDAPRFHGDHVSQDTEPLGLS